jgi:hypothetical protein
MNCKVGAHIALVIVGVLLVGPSPVQASDSKGQHAHPSRLEVRRSFGPDSVVTCDLRELFRYTPVNGLQPGVLCGWRRGARSEDTLMRVDVGLNLGTGGESDGLLGLRWRRRSWSLAEVGAQVHSLTDTSDQWRTDRLQSSLSFALQNRPDADYYRRSGLVLFATALPTPHLLVGAEYRADEYASLATRGDLWILPSDMEVVRHNPAIEAGQMGSLLLRLEWSSQPIDRADVGSVWRHPERSLVTPRPSRQPDARLLLRSWSTLEIARPALGSDERLAFTRLVSEHRLEIASGPLQGLRLRGRLAAGSGAPPQKQEGLGGWTAARGFVFNRYRGDLSLLGTVEYGRGRLAVFTDAGAVREPAGWSDLLAGVGARIRVWRGLHVAAAWRATTVGRQAFPSIRILLTDGW